MRHSDIHVTVNTYNDLNRLGFHEAIESLAPSKELTAILTDSSDFSCQNMSFSDQNKKLEEQNLKCSKSINYMLCHGMTMKEKLVGAARFELATFCSQSRRATNCAMPRTESH